MDKQELKALLIGFEKGIDITVNFVGGKGGVAPGSKADSPRGKGESGEYRVLESKRGRGKDGSRLCTLMSLASDNIIEIGTPNNNEIMNIITADGVIHGAKSESELPRVFPKADETQTQTFKESLRPFLKLNGVETKVQVESTIPEYNGVFTLLLAKLNVGRFGQITMNLKAEDGSEWTLKSHDHASVITSVKAVK
jgi:hypothetical protein